MNKVMSLRVGQYVLLLLSILMVGAGSGMFATVILWRLPLQARNWASLIEISGMVGFVVLGVWKSCDDWAAKTAAVTRT